MHGLSTDIHHIVSSICLPNIACSDVLSHSVVSSRGEFYQYQDHLIFYQKIVKCTTDSIHDSRCLYADYVKTQQVFYLNPH